VSAPWHCKFSLNCHSRYKQLARFVISKSKIRSQKNLVGRYQKLSIFLNVYFCYIGQGSDFNSSCSKIVLKSLGLELKMRVCSVNRNTGICWFYLDYWLIRRTWSKKKFYFNMILSVSHLNTVISGFYGVVFKCI
jgi:hypothetical protein